MNMDPIEILAKELWFYQLASLDGLNSGVPTRTTATLTPTTLRSIEQTFIELQCQAEQHSSQAGFVPPAIAPNTLGVQSVGFTGGSLCVSPGPGSSSGSVSQGSVDSSLSPAPPSPAAPRRRGMGGRRPARAPQHLSPEEEERRNMRRERNKMAAARCRKRRLDRTNELSDETEGLEKKKMNLQEEIRQLQAEREDLQLILETHRACCRLGTAMRNISPPDMKPILIASEPKLINATPYSLDGCSPYLSDNEVTIKQEIMDPALSLDSDVFTSPQTNKRVMLSHANPQVVSTPSSMHSTMSNPVSSSNPKPNRPNFLNVPVNLPPGQPKGEVAGIPITTPSSGTPFNFDSIMDGGSGLTPVQLCATQQHRLNGTPGGDTDKLVIL